MSSTPKRKVKQGRSGGKAGSGGYSYQAQVAAYVATHILAESCLGWAGNNRNDFPVALLSETGNLGDDIQVELTDSSFRLDAQVKKGLTGGSKLLEALQPFAEIPNNGTVEGVLVVDSNTSQTVAHHLRDDLRRVRQGRFDDLHAVTAEVLSNFNLWGAEHAPNYLAIVPMLIEERSDPHRRAAVEMLRRVLGNALWAEVAFELLENYCLKQIKDRGRLTKAEIVAYLSSRNIEPMSLPMIPAGLGWSATSSAPAKLRADIELDQEEEIAFAVGDRLGEQLDWAKAQLELNMPTRALELLASIETQAQAAKAPSKVFFRIHAHAGVALFRLQRLSEAQLRFESALALVPESVGTILNLARTLVIQGKKGEAIEHARRAVRMNPASAEAWGLIESLGARGGDEPPPSVIASIEWADGLASAMLDKGEWEDGIQQLRQNVEREPSLERNLSLAYALLTASQYQAASSLRKDQLAEAELLLDRAIASFTDGGFSIHHEQALLMRASILRARGAIALAEVDASVCLRLHPLDMPERWRPAAMLADIQLEQGNGGSALATLSPFQGSGEISAAQVLFAKAQFALQRSAEGRSTLVEAIDALLSRKSDQSNAKELAVGMIEVALEASELELARDLLGRAASLDLGWIAKLQESRIEAAARNYPAAVDSLAEGIEKASGASLQSLRLELALMLSNLERYEDAAQAFEDANVWEEAVSFRAPYLNALLQSERYEKAFALLQPIIDALDAPDWALWSFALLLERQGNLEPAAQFLARALARRPESVEARLRLASIHVRMGALEKAATLLESLLDRASLSAAERFMLSTQLFEVGDRTVAVQQAFRSLREARGTPNYNNIRRAYVSLFLRAEQAKAVPSTVMVGPDTRVSLARIDRNTKGTTAVLDLVGGGNADLLANEVLATDPYIVPLLGKRRGDVVALEGRSGRRGRYRVAKIESLPGMAFSRSVAELVSDKQDPALFRSISLGVEGTVSYLMPIFETMFGQQRQEAELFAMYTQYGVPLGMLAEISGRPFVEIYWLAQSRAPHLLTEHGDAESLRRVADVASSDLPLAITRSALATIQSLRSVGIDLLQVLTAQGRELIVTQSFIDELHEERRQLLLGAESGATRMSAGAAGFEIVERSPQELRVELDRFDALLEQLKLRWKVEPVPFYTFTPEFSEKRKLVGDTTIDSIEVCRATGAALLADDRGHCDLARDRGVGQFTSTRALVQAMGSSGLIGQDVARAAISHLARLKHYFLPVNADLLVGLTRDADYKIAAQDRALFRRLADDAVDLEQGISVAGSSLFEVAARGGLGGAVLREMAQTFLVDLCDAHPYELVTEMLMSYIKERFLLLPQRNDELLALIRDFRLAKRASGRLN